MVRETQPFIKLFYRVSLVNMNLKHVGFPLFLHSFYSFFYKLSAYTLTPVRFPYIKIFNVTHHPVSINGRALIFFGS